MAPNNNNLNKDELEAPAWMNIEFFTKVLHFCENDATIKVRDLQMSPATAKGDHYASVMFRAIVKYDNVKTKSLSTMSMIIKTMPETEGVKMDMLKESHIFETEIAMYAKVIPKFESMLRAIGDETQLGARCLYYSLTPKKVIIFEDIVPLGYDALRGRPITTEEAKLAYLKLAKWHAVSFIINKENPDFFKNLDHDIMELVRKDMGEIIEAGIDILMEVLDSRPTLAKYRHYFEAIKPGLFDKCTASFNEYRVQPQKDSYYVLCHGDFHSKNMMLKHNAANKLEDIMLIDFQLSFVGSPALDIIYSIIMMLNREQRIEQVDELIHYYFSNYIETLQRLGYDGKLPKLLDFRQMIMRHVHFLTFLLVNFLPLWHAFQDTEGDPDEMMKSLEYRRQLYFNKMYGDELEKILPKFLHLGYLEN